MRMEWPSLVTVSFHGSRMYIKLGTPCVTSLDVMDVLTALCLAGLAAGRIAVYGESILKQPAISLCSPKCTLQCWL
jgi:hypothetical protein